MKNILYIVSTPIGNYEDISIRALKILRSVDFVICEEFKEGSKILRKFKIKKDLFSINEHNEKENTPEIISMLKNGKVAALISDCGTPLFSDPGHFLVDQCVNSGIQIKPIPGANSLINALVGSNLNFEKFYYYGWLSPKKEIRLKQLHDLKNEKKLLLFMETPYRLKQLLTDIIKVFSANVKTVLAYKLTQPEEKFYRDTAKQILKIAIEQKLKGEFVLLIDNRETAKNKLQRQNKSKRN